MKHLLTLNDLTEKEILDLLSLADKLKKGKAVSGEELVDLIRECQNYIVSLYNLSGKIPLDAALDLIFTLLPIFENCIMLYYQNHYDEEQGKHALHDEWMSVFVILNSEEFLNRIQDDLFLKQRKMNRQVNEYLAYHKTIVTTYKQKIDQLLVDLEECGGEDSDRPYPFSMSRRKPSTSPCMWPSAAPSSPGSSSLPAPCSSFPRNLPGRCMPTCSQPP